DGPEAPAGTPPTSLLGCADRCTARAGHAPFRLLRRRTPHCVHWSPRRSDRLSSESSARGSQVPGVGFRGGRQKRWPTSSLLTMAGEFHPAFEEYCEAIFELKEDDLDVIQARIAERLL